LVGGGNPPRPGEISLAHHGVLFLDELPEFNRASLDMLREPMESGHVLISRAKYQACFPAQFQLIAAMNPCPCGYYGDRKHPCRCIPDRVERYQQKISGPLLDRIDIQISLTRQTTPFSTDVQGEPSSSTVRKRVCKAKERQLTRSGCANAWLDSAQLTKTIVLKPAETKLLNQATENMLLSARAHQHMLRMARTIADLANCETIEKEHLSEALLLRQLDRCRTLV